jgi:hypothetical protein
VWLATSTIRRMEYSRPQSASSATKWPIKPHHPTPTSRPVSMFSCSSNPYPEINFRPRW